MTLTKEDLIDSIYNQVGLPKKKSSQLVESILEIITKALKKKDTVTLIQCRGQTFQVKTSRYN